MRLAGKVAIITGGGSGIGLAAARRFVAEGARVVVAGRTAERVEKAAAEIGGEVLAVAGDVATAEGAERLVTVAIDRWGRLDILVNNHAALNMPGRVHEISEDDWDYVLRNNLKGYFLTAKAALPRMVAQRSGAIVMVTSETIQAVTLYVGAYAASKGGAAALAKAIAAEYAEFGIRCNCLQVGATPGTLASKPLVDAGADMSLVRDSRRKTIPLGRMGTPEDHANALVFLASDESSWVTGAVLNVDGGYTSV
jgi:NAD(P)-dependent dehydrogenase (short-subunit alcohol dehydrogenase family)